jgi:hypothetical protein
VELADGVGDGVEGAAVVCAHVAFAEVVGLDLGVVTSEPFPINLNMLVILKYSRVCNIPHRDSRIAAQHW